MPAITGCRQSLGLGLLSYFYRKLSSLSKLVQLVKRYIVGGGGFPGAGRRSMKPIIHVMKPCRCRCKDIISIADQPSSGERLAVRGWGSRLDREGLLRGEFHNALEQMHSPVFWFFFLLFLLFYWFGKKAICRVCNTGSRKGALLSFVHCAEPWPSQENSASCDYRILNTFCSNPINYTSFHRIHRPDYPPP